MHELESVHQLNLPSLQGQMAMHSGAVDSFKMHAAFTAAPGRLLQGLGVGRAGARARCAVRPMMSATGVDSAVRAAIKENNVMVFSKSWCPYCDQVKGLFSHLGVEHTVWELDEVRARAPRKIEQVCGAGMADLRECECVAGGWSGCRGLPPHGNRAEFGAECLH